MLCQSWQARDGKGRGDYAYLRDSLDRDACHDILKMELRKKKDVKGFQSPFMNLCDCMAGAV